MRVWVDSFLFHHAEEFFEMKSIPQEETRLQMSWYFLEAQIEDIGTCFDSE
jgi:hypothetical protein